MTKRLMTVYRRRARRALRRRVPRRSLLAAAAVVATFSFFPTILVGAREAAAANGPSVAGAISTIAGDGTAGTAGDGSSATAAELAAPGAIVEDSVGNVYVADTANNRVEEIAGSTGTEWGMSMTAGDVYTVAGDSGGTSGLSGDGGLATAAGLDAPTGLALDSIGDLFVADSDNNRVQEIARIDHSQWGVSMTANDVYTVAGDSGGSAGHTGDLGAATSALLSGPEAIALDASNDLYIADAGNNRVEEVAASTGTGWGISMTADDIYTVAGSSGGTAGHTGDLGSATSALLSDPQALALDASGNLYVADTANNRVQEVAASTGTEWGVSMTADDIYTFKQSWLFRP